MTVRVSIGGVNRPVHMNSIRLSHSLGAPSTGSFALREVLPKTVLACGQEVVIYDDVETETIDQSIPTPNPPGLRYEPMHTGYVKVSVTHRSRAAGTFEGIFANLYNLPDLRLMDVESDWFLVGGQITHTYSGQWIEVGLLWTVADGKYYYAAKFYASSSTTLVVSTTAVVLDESVRFSATWESGETTTDLILYVNGVAEVTTSVSGTMERTDPGEGGEFIWITGQGADVGVGQYFSDIRVFLDVRSAYEINANKFKRLESWEFEDTDLELYWQCDETTGTDVADSGTYGNDGVLDDEDLGGDYNLVWRVAPDPWIPNSGPTYAPAVVPYRYFGGRVDSNGGELAEPSALIQHVKLIDYSEACNRKIVGQNFMSEHDGKYYMNYIGLHQLEPEGIMYGAIPDGSPDFSVPNWTAKTARGAMDDIYTATGWMWYIDPYKELRYHALGYVSAPFNIADTDSPSNFLANSMTLELDREDYYNQIFARIAVEDSGSTDLYVIRISNTEEIVARAAIEGNSGVYQRFEDITNAASLEQGISLAQGKLTNASKMGQIVCYETRTGGLRVGQTQTIENSDLGIDGTFLIEKLDIEQDYPGWKYSVTASSWKRYKNAALANSLASAINGARNWTQNIASYSDVPYVPTY